VDVLTGMDACMADVVAIALVFTTVVIELLLLMLLEELDTGFV
jgi:hypothetical protein